MFEFDFFKLIILAMIGLLVLGPEKLPGLAAKLGHWAGRARSVARQLRTQLEQEVMLEEERQRQRKEKETAKTKPTPASNTAEAVPTTTPTAEPAHPSHNPDEHAHSEPPHDGTVSHDAAAPTPAASAEVPPRTNP